MEKIMISDNIKNIKERINAAKKQAGRENDVTLVAVTKTRSVEEIMQVIDSGVKDLGENRVQEFMEKYDKLPSDVRWHISEIHHRQGIHDPLRRQKFPRR